MIVREISNSSGKAYEIKTESYPDLVKIIEARLTNGEVEIEGKTYKLFSVKDDPMLGDEQKSEFVTCVGVLQKQCPNVCRDNLPTDKMESNTKDIITRIEEAKELFYMRHGIEPNTVIMGRKEREELFQFSRDLFRVSPYTYTQAKEQVDGMDIITHDHSRLDVGYIVKTIEPVLGMKTATDVAMQRVRAEMAMQQADPSDALVYFLGPNLSETETNDIAEKDEGE